MPVRHDPPEVTYSAGEVVCILRMCRVGESHKGFCRFIQCVRSNHADRWYASGGMNGGLAPVWQPSTEFEGVRLESLIR